MGDDFRGPALWRHMRANIRPARVQNPPASALDQLVLVCAPAGWGKTSVLSQWHSAEPGAFAWVSLDPGDDDRVRFWSYVIGAVRTVAPEVGEAALAALPNAPGDLTGAGAAVAAQRAGSGRAPPGAGAG